MDPVALRSAALLLAALLALPQAMPPASTPSGARTSTAPAGYILAFTAEMLGLQGYDMRSLHAALCVNGRPVEVPIYVMPRGTTKAYLADAGGYITLLSYGSPLLQRSDIIIVYIPAPIPLGLADASACSWGRHYALERLHNRVLVTLEPRSPILVLKGSRISRAWLGKPLTIMIYYDRGPGFPPRAAPASEMLWLIKLATGAKDWRLLQKARRFYANAAKLTGLHARISVQHRSHWLLTRDLSSLAARETPSPDLVYIDGGGAGLDIYWFAVQIVPSERPVLLDPGETKGTEIYLGDNLLDAGLHVIAVNKGSTIGCIEATLVIKTGSTVESIITRRAYIPSGGETKIDLYPWSLSLSKYYTVKAVVKNCGATRVEVKLASLDWTKNPAPGSARFERTGVEILSYGLKGMCQTCSRIHNVAAEPPHYGIVFRPADFNPPKKAVAFLYTYPNGVHLTSNGEGQLIVDVAVYNNGDTAVHGHVWVEVNGYRYKTFNVDATPGIHVYRLTLPLREVLDYFQYAAGGIIVVATDMASPTVKIAVDSELTYRYMPEVWNPKNIIAWVVNPSPVLKAEFSQIEGFHTAFKTSIVAERTVFDSYSESPLIVAVEVSRPRGLWQAVHSVELRVTLPSGFELQSLQGQVKTDKDKWFRELERHIGLAQALHGILTTASAALEFVTNVPTPLSATLFISGLVLDILAEAESVKTVEVKQIGDNIVYVIRWSAGAGDVGFVQLRLVAITAQGLDPGIYEGSVAVRINYAWEAKGLPLKIEVVRNPAGSLEPPGYYSTKGIIYS